MTKEITVTVSGSAATGKTFIVELLAQFLHNMDIKTVIDYGSDGNPLRTQEDRSNIYNVIRDQLNVTIVEKYTAREPTNRENIETQ